jgi:hypothetical protein
MQQTSFMSKKKQMESPSTRISEFRRQLPDHPGRLVLQDLPEAISQARTQALHPSIEIMEHDLFTEQPIKGELSIIMSWACLTDIIISRGACVLHAFHSSRLGR